MKTQQVYIVLVVAFLATTCLPLVDAQCLNAGTGYNQADGIAGSGTSKGQLIGTGADWNTHYGNNEACTWQITCDPGYFAAIARLRTEFRDTGDGVTFNDGSTNFLTINSGNDRTQRRALMSNTNILRIDFASDSSNSDRNGIEGYLRCYPAKCTDDRDPVTTTVFPASFGTDDDGVSSGSRVGINEDCVWPLQCPAGQFVTFAGTSAVNELGAHQQMTFRDASDITISRIFDSTDEPKPTERFIGTSNVGYVRLSSGLTANQQADGVSFDVDCLTVQCSIETLTTITAYPHTFQSDADGAGSASAVDQRGENCEITVQCPGGQFGIWTYTGDISGTGNAVELQTSASAQIVQFTSSVTESKWVHNSNEYKFLYTTNPAGSDVLNGFTLTHDCIAAQCSAYPSTSTVTSFPLTIKSDADGELGASTYANGEACNVLMQCPTGFKAKIEWSVDTADANDFFEVQTSGGATVAGPFNGALTGGSHVGTDEFLRLRWTTNSDGIVGNGFTATLNCGLNCVTDPPVNPSFIHRPTSIKIFQYAYLPLTTITCDAASVTAGHKLVCTVNVRGSCGDIFGDALDAGMIALAACPKEPHKTNGDSNTLIYNNGTYTAPGQFVFELWPRAAGITNVTVSIGNPLYKVPATAAVQVIPGEASPGKATSKCTVDDDGNQQCIVTHRDSLGNARQTCNMHQTGNVDGSSREQCTLL